MSRRRENSFDLLPSLLMLTLWCAGPLLAASVFVLFRYLLPALFESSSRALGTYVLVRAVYNLSAWVLAGIVLLVWIVAVIRFSKRRLFCRQQGIRSIRDLSGQPHIRTIRDLSWQEFERVVTEVYRRKGYVAKHIGSPSGDGGVDVLLYAHDEKVVIQCKHWRAFRVGVRPVRELLGAVVNEHASRGILITSGRFTSEAIQLAERNTCLQLIDGKRLAEMIEEIREIRDKQVSS